MTPDEIKQYFEEEFPEFYAPAPPRKSKEKIVGYTFFLGEEPINKGKQNNLIIRVEKPRKPTMLKLAVSSKLGPKVDLDFTSGTEQDLRNHIVGELKKILATGGPKFSHLLEPSRKVLQRLDSDFSSDLKRSHKLKASQHTTNTTLTSDSLIDIEELQDRDLNQTEKETLISARLGQGKFRKDVLAKWDDRCAITGIDLVAAIRASHIKPWKSSSDKERLDPANGLPLVANLDALFDVGLISFDDKGKLLTSSKLSDEQIRSLDLEKKRLLKKPNQKMRKFLGSSRIIVAEAVSAGFSLTL